MGPFLRFEASSYSTDIKPSSAIQPFGDFMTKVTSSEEELRGLRGPLDGMQFSARYMLLMQKVTWEDNETKLKALKREAIRAVIESKYDFPANLNLVTRYEIGMFAHEMMAQSQGLEKSAQSAIADRIFATLEAHQKQEKEALSAETAAFNAGTSTDLSKKMVTAFLEASDEQPWLDLHQRFLNGEKYQKEYEKPSDMEEALEAVGGSSNPIVSWLLGFWYVVLQLKKHIIKVIFALLIAGAVLWYGRSLIPSQQFPINVDCHQSVAGSCSIGNVYTSIKTDTCPSSSPTRVEFSPTAAKQIEVLIGEVPDLTFGANSSILQGEYTKNFWSKRNIIMTIKRVGCVK